MSGFELDGAAQGASLLMIAALAALIAFMIARASGFLPTPRRRGYSGPYPPARTDRKNGPDLTDVGEQLKVVMTAPFEKRRLLSPSEYRAFRIIEKEAAAERGGHRVFAQTSLGEILQSSDHSAFRSINSKRVDILVVDQGGWPLLAVEFHGNGHYQGTAAARDAVKREALRKAGVQYIEVSPTDSDDQIRCRVREKLGWKPSALANS